MKHTILYLELSKTTELGRPYWNHTQGGEEKLEEEKKTFIDRLYCRSFYFSQIIHKIVIKEE